MRWIRLILLDPLEQNNTVGGQDESDGEADVLIRLPLLPQRSFALAEAEKTHRGAMASHRSFPRVSLSLFTDTRCCRSAADLQRIASDIVYPAISRVSSIMPAMKGIQLWACDYKGCECTV